MKLLLLISTLFSSILFADEAFTSSSYIVVKKDASYLVEKVPILVDDHTPKPLFHAIDDPFLTSSSSSNHEEESGTNLNEVSKAGIKISALLNKHHSYIITIDLKDAKNVKAHLIGAIVEACYKVAGKAHRFQIKLANHEKFNDAPHWLKKAITIQQQQTPKTKHLMASYGDCVGSWQESHLFIKDKVRIHRALFLSFSDQAGSKQVAEESILSENGKTFTHNTYEADLKNRNLLYTPEKLKKSSSFTLTLNPSTLSWECKGKTPTQEQIFHFIEFKKLLEYPDDYVKIPQPRGHTEEQYAK